MNEGYSSGLKDGLFRAKEMLKYNEATEKCKERSSKMPNKECIGKSLEKARQEVKERNGKVPVKSKMDMGAR